MHSTHHGQGASFKWCKFSSACMNQKT
jgi:hypothetical protein